MASKIKVDTLETANGSGTIALSNQLSGMTTASLPTLTSAEMPSGSVLQVVTATDQTQRSTTSTSYVTAGNTLAVNITPISTSSKILVLVSVIGGHSTGGGKIAYFTIFRGSTDLGSTAGNGNGLSQNYGGSSDVRTSMNMNILDSPSTTSQITYQVYIKDDGSSGQVDLNWNNCKGTITAMEIGG